MSSTKAGWLTFAIILAIVIVSSFVFAGVLTAVFPAVAWLWKGLNLGVAIWCGMFGISRIYDALRY